MLRNPILEQQEPVIIKKFNDYVDEYGQKHMQYDEYSSTMFIRKYKQPIDEANPIFNNVCLIGLTKDYLDDTMNVIYQGSEYHVAYTIEGTNYKQELTWNQCFLEKYGSNN